MPAKPSGRHQNAAARRGRRRALTWVTALAVPGLGVVAATCWLLASAETRTPSTARIALARTMAPTPTAWAGRVLTGTGPAGTGLHLSLPNARYFHDHLPDGAEVAVF